MRSKLSCLTAAMMFFGALASAHAAEPKAESKKGGSKKKSSEMVNDNFDKQMQWETNVMGPDDKKAELAKIARASAISKAAAEKAAVEKAAAERNAAREETKRTPATKNAAPVLLATPEDENAGRSTKTPRVSTEDVVPPPAPVKPTDDRFIDKLLKGEPNRKKVVRNDDELNDLLAKDKIAPAPKPKGKRVDSVDDLLRSAEKQPDMPAPKAKTPDWAKIENAPAPAPLPVAVRPPPKKDDGVIHIVQGAAGMNTVATSRPQVAAAAPSRRSQNADSFDRRDADSFDAPRKRTGAKSAAFSDPFADNSSPAPRTRSFAPPARPAAPPPAPRMAPVAPRHEVSSPPPGWSDPFADSPSDRGGKPAKRAAEPKHAAPAGHPPGWKDPFSDAAPVRHHGSSHAAALVAMRDSPAKRASASNRSTWSVLKRPSHH